MTSTGPRLHHTVLDQHPDAQHPRIAFCHGLFGQGRNWTSIAKSLSDSYAATLIDMPNHGRSDWTESVDYRAVGDQLATFLAELGGDEQWILVGHSMGGKIAMAVALQHPELVSRLCVVDIAPIDYRGKSDFDTYVQAMRAVDLDRLQSRSDADDQLRAAVPDSTVRGFLLQNLRRSQSSGWHWQMNLRSLGDHLDELADWPDFSPAPYDKPTLWVAGADSDYVGPRSSAAMKELFPQARSVKIKNAGHWVHADQPDVFLAVLRRFLDAD